MVNKRIRNVFCLIIAVIIGFFSILLFFLDFSNTKVHISIDDCQECFIELRDTSRESLFDYKYWVFYKKLHDWFDCKITLYTSSDSILEESKRFRAEFVENSEWLKIGFHAVSDTLIDSVSEYDFFCENVVSNIGAEILSNALRLHYFEADSVFVQHLKDRGVVMLLCADDGRLNYDLSEEENDELNRDEIFCKNGMLYVTSDIRLEKTKMIFPALLRNNNEQHLVIFTHEWALDRFVKLKMVVLCSILKIKKVIFS